MSTWHDTNWHGTLDERFCRRCGGSDLVVTYCESVLSVNRGERSRAGNTFLCSQLLDPIAWHVLFWGSLRNYSLVSYAPVYPVCCLVSAQAVCWRLCCRVRGVTLADAGVALAAAVRLEA